MAHSRFLSARRVPFTGAITLAAIALSVAPVSAIAQTCIGWTPFESPLRGPDFSFGVDNRRGVLVMLTPLRESWYYLPMNQTWEFDGSRWSLRGIDGPRAASRGTIAFDPRRGLCVTFSPDTRFTWTPMEWNGQRWTPHPPDATPPGELRVRSAEWDPTRNAFLVLSESPNGGLETWQWDAGHWSRLDIPVILPALGDVRLSFDSRHSRMLLLTLPTYTFWSVGDVRELTATQWRVLDDSVPPAFRNSTLYLNNCGFSASLGALVVVAGGEGSTWLWDGSWRQARPTLGFGRFLSGFPGVYFERRGQSVSMDSLGRLVAFDGTDWTPLHHVGPRSSTGYPGQVLGHDSFRGRGVALTDEGETWELHDRAWRPVANDGPTDWIRIGPSAFDASRNLLVVFGGRVRNPTNPPDYADYSGVTSTWDGFAWRHQTQLGPGPRQGAGMAYDSSRASLVLFGGEGRISASTAGFLSDTWEWQGTFWRRLAIEGPSARTLASMAFDAERRRVVLAGGLVRDANGNYRWSDEVWEWDGNLWSPAPRLPQASDSPRLVFDDARHALLLSLNVGAFPYTLHQIWSRTSAGWEPLPANPSAQHVIGTFIPSESAVISLDGQSFLQAYPPVILTPPNDLVPPPARPAVFDVLATPSNLITYQWRRNGVPLHDNSRIHSAATPRLEIFPWGVIDAGFYDCVCSNSCGNATSAQAQLHVGCIADLDDGTLNGVRDGGVTIDDLLYYLLIYQLGRYYADLDDGTSTGTPDGGVTIDDLLFFLFRYDAGC